MRLPEKVGTGRLRLAGPRFSFKEQLQLSLSVYPSLRMSPSVHPVVRRHLGGSRYPYIYPLDVLPIETRLPDFRKQNITVGGAVGPGVP